VCIQWGQRCGCLTTTPLIAVLELPWGTRRVSLKTIGLEYENGESAGVGSISKNFSDLRSSRRIYTYVQNVRLSPEKLWLLMPSCYCAVDKSGWDWQGHGTGRRAYGSFDFQTGPQGVAGDLPLRTRELSVPARYVDYSGQRSIGLGGSLISTVPCLQGITNLPGMGGHGTFL